MYHYIYRPPTVCLHCSQSRPEKDSMQRHTAPCHSLSLGNFYSHTCIRNNGIKPKGAMLPLCGKFTIKLAKSPTTSCPSARPAYEIQMVIVNRKSVFFLSLSTAYAKSVGVYSYYVVASSQATYGSSCSLEGPYSPGRSLVFCTRVKHHREIVIVYIPRE